MRSLFVRIWLSFWIVLAATFAAALAISFAIAVKRQEIDTLSPPALAAQGGQALARGGEDSLRQWLLRTHNEHPEMDVMILDPHGREIRGRAPQEVARALAAPRGAGPFPAVVDAPGPRGAYRFIFRRQRSLNFDLWDILLQPAALLGLVIVISGLGSAWLARYLADPVLRLRGGVRALAAGDLDARVGKAMGRRRDELGALARDFDAMAAELRALIASKEELLREVSHELRTPLARLRVISDLGRRHAVSPEAVGDFDLIDREIGRLDGLIGQILGFSRLEGRANRAFDPIDLAELLETAVEDARFEAEAQGKQVALELVGRPAVTGDPAQLSSAVENLLRNAIRFAPAGTAVQVVAGRRADGVHIEVRDDGPGVAPPDLPRIFQPFVRGEGSPGLGLGLAIARRIATLHGGTITAGNRPEGGFAVRLVLPAGPAPEAAAAT